jgi:hypothetical protein
VLASVKRKKWRRGENLQPLPPFIGDREREREREREGQGGSHESATDPSVEPKSVTSGALVSPAPRSLTSGPQSGF